MHTTCSDAYKFTYFLVKSAVAMATGSVYVLIC